MSVRYLTEAGDVDCDWVTLYDGPDSCCILFTTDSLVTDFTLLDLFAEDFTETGAVIFSATPVELDGERGSLPSVMTPDTPVAVQLIFPGDLPSYGISYVDAEGKPAPFRHCSQRLRRLLAAGGGRPIGDAVYSSGGDIQIGSGTRTIRERSAHDPEEYNLKKKASRGVLQYEKNTILCHFVSGSSLPFRLLSPQAHV